MDVRPLFSKYKILLLGVLKPLGFWGVGAIAVLDSSSIPVPMDLIVAGYVWNDPRHFYLYVLMAALGSAIGGLLPYLIGRAGGEIFLMKRIDRERYEKMRDRFERQEFLALLIPSMLPPPTPWKLFVFAAGVFEMRIRDFLIAVFAGRIIRFTALSLLTIRYGPEIVHEVGEMMHRHLFGTLIGLALLLIVLALVMLRKSMGKDKRPGMQTDIGA
jgi:membrane protein YqaA with SNARE-associated domain